MKMRPRRDKSEVTARLLHGEPLVGIAESLGLSVTDVVALIDLPDEVLDAPPGYLGVSNAPPGGETGTFRTDRCGKPPKRSATKAARNRAPGMGRSSSTSYQSERGGRRG